MRKFGVFVASLVFLFMVQAALAQPPGFVAIMGLTPDIANGGALAAEKCAGCHGADGNPVDGWPRLAGQIRTYELMNPIAANLSDQDIADLTAWFSSQTPASAPFPDQDPMLVGQGAVIFNQGNFESGVIACAICHGVAGEGVEQLGIPRIAGQSPRYLNGAIATFANLPDTGIGFLSAMTINVSRLTPEEVDAIVAYLASQPWGNP